MCEQMATPAHIEDTVPLLWDAATRSGITGPDWHVRGRPQYCRLDVDDYRALLRERATDVRIAARGDRVTASGPDGSVLMAWRGTRHVRTPVTQGEADIALPDGSGDGAAAVFTWRGDYRASGWLSRYTEMTGDDPGSEVRR